VVVPGPPGKPDQWVMTLLSAVMVPPDTDIYTIQQHERRGVWGGPRRSLALALLPRTPDRLPV